MLREAMNFIHSQLLTRIFREKSVSAAESLGFDFSFDVIDLRYNYLSEKFRMLLRTIDKRLIFIVFARFPDKVNKRIS
jgi:hypothetical protein